MHVVYYAFTTVSVTTTTTTATTTAAVIDLLWLLSLRAVLLIFYTLWSPHITFASTTTRAYNSSVVRSESLNIIPETLGTWRGV